MYFVVIYNLVEEIALHHKEPYRDNSVAVNFSIYHLVTELKQDSLLSGEGENICDKVGRVLEDVLSIIDLEGESYVDEI